MRRGAQELPRAESVAILKKATSGVLAVCGDDDYPYAVPLSFIYDDAGGGDGALYFHGAVTGHKLDAIARNDKVSFCVIETDSVQPAEFTTYFRSVIVFGRARVLRDAAEKRRAIEILAKKYSPDKTDAETKTEIDSSWERLCMIELRVEHISGKEAKEFMMKRKGM